MSKITFLDATPKLARMLAGERLTVVHGNYETASFDTKDRVLRLPVFKEELMNKDFYTMFVAHEVGHALETPRTWNHDLQREIPGCPQMILNIVEDIRIEKLIRRKYTGLYKTFVSAYNTVLNRDMFGINGMDISKLGFLNRLNLHAKAGDIISVPFNADEQKMVDIAMQIETWDDTLRVTKLLKDFAEEQDQKLSELQQSGGQGQGDQGEGQGSDQSEGVETGQGRQVPAVMQRNVDTSTDQNFRSAEKTLIESDDLRIIRVSRKEALAQINTSGKGSATRRQDYRTFQRKFSPFIQRMVTQFNMRQAARKQMLNAEAKTGRLDPLKLPEFAYNEDIFVRYGVDPKQQNHSIMMFVDTSLSMREGCRIRYVALQAAIMADFCRTLNIPFKVYGWTSNSFGYSSPGGYTNSLRPANISLWVDSMMSASKYKAAIGWLYGVSTGDSIQMSGTPLTETKAIAAVLVAEERAKRRADKVHVIILTDGDGSGNLNTIDSSNDSDHTFRRFFIQIEGLGSKTVSYGSRVQDERAIDDILRAECDHYMHIDVGSSPRALFTEKLDVKDTSSSYDSQLSISGSLRSWATSSFSPDSGTSTDDQYRAFRKLSGLVGKFLAYGG